MEIQSVSPQPHVHGKSCEVLVVGIHLLQHKMASYNSSEVMEVSESPVIPNWFQKMLSTASIHGCTPSNF